MQTFKNHTLERRWCHICGATTEHEDGECDSPFHEENFFNLVEGLSTNDERRDFLRKETGRDENEIVKYLMDNGLLKED